jgi:hypothetical protein
MGAKVHKVQVGVADSDIGSNIVKTNRGTAGRMDVMVTAQGRVSYGKWP